MRGEIDEMIEVGEVERRVLEALGLPYKAEWLAENPIDWEAYRHALYGPEFMKFVGQSLRQFDPTRIGLIAAVRFEHFFAAPGDARIARAIAACFDASERSTLMGGDSDVVEINMQVQLREPIRFVHSTIVLSKEGMT